MDKGINLYLTKKLDEETLLPMIQKAGFDSVIVPFETINDRGEKNTKELLKKHNLKVQMIHCRYNKDQLDDFWDNDSEIGNQLLDDYIYQLEKIKGFAPVDFVIHLVNTPGDRYTKIGEDRLKKLITVAKKYNIRLCAENTYSAYQQEKIFENISDDNLRMCYDVGHENWLTPGANLFEKLNPFIVKLHLHNNDGIYDWHQPIFEGSVDYDNVAKYLASIDRELPLCLELKFVDDRLTQEFFDSMKDSLDKLENMINKYKKR